MNKKICFILDGNELFVDEVFVDFNNLPIYFSCTSGEQYYLALCCEYENQDYILVESSAKEIVEMLTARITIRSTIVKKAKHWVIIAGEDVSSDQISLINEPYFNEDILPKEGAKYTIVTEKVSQYLKRIEKELYSDELYTAVEMEKTPIDNNETQFEHIEITTPIEVYVGCFVIKTKYENVLQTSPSVSFAYEKDCKLQSNNISKKLLGCSQVFELENYKKRIAAA